MRSRALFCFTAQITPRDTPSTDAISTENSASSMVAGSRSPISCMTGSPLNSESPKSPWNICPR